MSASQEKIGKRESEILMTPSQQAKAYGLKTLTEVEKVTGKPTRTITRWFYDEPKLFEAVCRGCMQMKYGDEK